MPPTCDDPPPAALLAGIEQFNQGEYFECHETLEAIWMREPGTIRRLYQGILQIGVGLYHLRNGNYRGTLNLLGSGTAYLEPFAPHCMGVQLDALLAAARALRDQVAALGPTGFHAVDPAGFPQIHVTVPVDSDPPVSTSVAPDALPGHW
jgi:predicted metal-dependent hydrolase